MILVGRVSFVCLLKNFVVVAEKSFTKPPLFQRNRLTCSGNPLFESCVEVKSQ